MKQHKSDEWNMTSAVKQSNSRKKVTKTPADTNNRWQGTATNKEFVFKQIALKFM